MSFVVRRVGLLIISIVLVAMLGLTACVPAWGQPGWGGGMMGSGGGMMGGGWGDYNRNPNTQPITIDQAADAARSYVSRYGKNLALTEVMDFAWNFYAEAVEKDTGIRAMELIIDKYTGQVSAEMGPDTMWNAKYSPMAGMMGGIYYTGRSPTANMSVSPEQARVLAQQFLDANLPGVTVAEADTFYGYYTLHTLRNGQIEGMLSINGNSGAVWYHTWHGTFIGMKEF